MSSFQQIWVQHLAFFKLLMAKFCLFNFFVHGNPAIKLLPQVRMDRSGQHYRLCYKNAKKTYNDHCDPCETPLSNDIFCEKLGRLVMITVANKYKTECQTLSIFPHRPFAKSVKQVHSLNRVHSNNT